MDARNGCAARCRFCAFGGEGGDCCGRGVMGEGHSLPDDPQQSCLDPIRVCGRLFFCQDQCDCRCALSQGGGGPHGCGVLCHAAGSSHLVSMPTRAVLDSDMRGALLRGQNPFDRIYAPSCCCGAAVRVGCKGIFSGAVCWVWCLGTWSGVQASGVIPRPMDF
jgi:hypothetical protein